MNRPASPLLHDYKPSPRRQPPKPNALRWFVFGLGLPLLCLSLFLMLGSEPAIEAEAREVAATATTEPGAADFYPPFDPIAIPERLARGVGPQPPYTAVNLTIGRGDTMDGLFRSNRLNIGDLIQIARLPEVAPHLRRLNPGDNFEVRHDDGRIVELYHDLDLTSSLLVTREEGGFKAQIVDRPIEIRRRVAHGRIETSLFESALGSGLSDNLVMNLAGIFAWDIDFVLDIRRGDEYYVLFEEIYQDGEYVKNGEIIAAEFLNDGDTYQAVRFIDGENRADYYTPEGRSVRKAFIRAPVDFTRISSSFNPQRKHPILNTIRAHRGVDYAAPTGTPIYAAGDGKIIHRGTKGGYGNTVILQHGGNITTLYAHLSSFAKTARYGQRVKQGQVIGFVGKSGLATAAHLHYEYRLNGVHRNPRTVALPDADPIKAEYKQQFLAAARPALDELEQFKSKRFAASLATAAD